MLKRNIAVLLEKMLKRSQVVLLNGARQVGKTTLVKEYVDHKYHYVTFDDELTMLRAQESPSGFIANLPKPVVIDEVQRVPEIFLPIKKDVDENEHPGRYFLTGSANPLTMPEMADSLMGRMEIVDLFPLSQGELIGHVETFIDTAFSGDHFKVLKNPLTKQELYQKIVTGGYPKAQNKSDEDREGWFDGYLGTLLGKDIGDIADIDKVDVLKLLQVFSARVAGLMNIAEIARDSKMDQRTVQRYLDILEAIFIVQPVLPWSTNITTRFSKAPKLFFTDCGFAAHIMGANVESFLKNDFVCGKFLENFVIGELRKQISWSKLRPRLYHFRSLVGDEVDIVLETKSGDIVGIEVKNSSHVSSSDLKGLRYLQDRVPKRFKRGVVLYTGNTVVTFEKNIVALPMNLLWQS